MQVVKIADTTLRRRLDEFRDTPSGALTVADFRTLWLDETADPPAFTENQKREQVKREQEEEKVRRREAGEESDQEDETFQAFAELAKQKEDTTTVFEEEDDEELEPVIPMSAKALGKRKQREEDDEEAAGRQAEELEAMRADPVLDETIASEMATTLDSAAGKALASELDKVEHRRATAAAALMNVRLDDSNNLDDLDEDELDAFILTPDEVAIKSRVWMEANLTYLQQLADKQTGPDGELKPAQARRVRKRNKPRDSRTAQGTDAADATRQMLAKKRFSKKINYAAIDELFKDKASERGSERGGGSTVAGSDDDDDLVEETPLLGKKHGQRMGVVGQRIEVPRPTFGARGRSRTGTPVAGLPRAPVAEVVQEEEEVEDEDEEEEDEEEEAPAQREEEEGESWRHLTQQGDGDDAEEDYGYGDEI